jgi:hypothetical protein
MFQLTAIKAANLQTTEEGKVEKSRVSQKKLFCFKEILRKTKKNQ